MINERSITIETTVIRDGDDYFVRVAYEGKQKRQFGPIRDSQAAHELAGAIAKSARDAIEFFLESQQFLLKVPA